MTRVLVIAVVLVAVFSVTTTVDAWRNPPRYTLNLDLPPKDRWRKAVHLVAETYGWDNSLGPLFGFFEPLFKLFPNGTRTKLQNVLQTRFPEHYAELEGMVEEFANLGHPEYDIKFASLFPFFYELGHIGELSDDARRKLVGQMCTGILSLPDDATKNILHGRNMDHTPGYARNMTLKIRVVKNATSSSSLVASSSGNKSTTLQFHALGWGWITTGFATGIKHKHVSVEINARLQKIPYTTLMALFLNNKTIPVVLQARMVLDQGLSFTDAHEFFFTNQRASPYYIIMSGTGRRGAILSVALNQSDTENNRIEFLNDTSSVAFKVQTNYDRWKPDPADDPRRTVATNALNGLGAEVAGTKWGVWMALEQYPVHNINTVYSAMMNVDEEDPAVFIRKPMIPL